MNAFTEEPAAPGACRVLRGSPDGAELAVLAAVLTALAGRRRLMTERPVDRRPTRAYAHWRHAAGAHWAGWAGR